MPVSVASPLSAVLVGVAAGGGSVASGARSSDEHAASVQARASIDRERCIADSNLACRYHRPMRTFRASPLLALVIIAFSAWPVGARECQPTVTAGRVQIGRPSCGERGGWYGL